MTFVLFFISRLFDLQTQQTPNPAAQETVLLPPGSEGDMSNIYLFIAIFLNKKSLSYFNVQALYCRTDVDHTYIYNIVSFWEIDFHNETKTRHELYCIYDSKTLFLYYAKIISRILL